MNQIPPGVESRLSIYRRFLLSELRSTDGPSRRHALWVQEQIPFADREIQHLRDLSRV